MSRKMTRTMDDDAAVSMLSALAQHTRFSVFRLLMKAGPNGLPAGKIAETVGVPQNTLSTHLNILSNTGLISSRREGRNLIYSVQLDDTKGLIEYLVNDCCDGHPEICAISQTETACISR
ncbi:MAG: ArsR/SmtB family transcription factor [Kordiimonas sp.]